MITGGAGFVGSHLCDDLVKHNHNVIVLTRNKSKLDNIAHLDGKITVEKVDITKFNQLGRSIEKHKPDIIVHLAGQTSHSKSFEDPLYDIDANTKSTLFILEKIRILRLKCRFVLGSTFIVVGKPKKLPVNERTPCNPTTIYGANRLTSEYYCQIYHKVYGLDTVVFRITNSFGPREKYTPNKNAINFLIYKAYKREKVTLFNKGKLYRDLIYISDVINAITIIIKKGKSGNVYWISSGKKLWFWQLGRLLNQLTGAEIEYVDSPTYTKKVDVGNFVVDNTKLKSLGWRSKFTIKHGLTKTLEYFQSLES